MFCWVINAEKDGLAKTVQVEGSSATVEYFDSPAMGSRYRKSVPLSSVRRKRLGRNTRVFTFDETESKWSIGRVLDDDGEGVEVRLAHKRDVYLPYENVFVRWKRPISDPVDFLGRFITETPQYAEARSAFMRNYVFQRGSVFGISALLSSSLELESHQIDVVRRVLSDHTQRYLLADEVGLGKTVEAGIIIRQAVLDDMRGHKVVVLVPHELVNQWRRELITRFGLLDYLDESVFVFPHECSEELKDALDGLTLLVVDEAHHLTAPNASDSIQHIYELVKEAAYRTEKLLLLSATPILRNESGFLRMLNLLDPVVYPLDDLEGFREKVTNRQSLAEAVASLDPSNSLFMDSVLDDLVERLPNDRRLNELTTLLKEKLVELPDESDAEFCASVRQLRAHISETYRLNRRILRNRRRQVEGLTPERKGVEVWQVESLLLGRVEAALEDWRIGASLAMSRSDGSRDFALVEFYWNAVCALSEGLHVFLKVCAERQSEIERRMKISFEGEQECLERILQVVDVDAWMDSRLERLSKGLETLPNSVKVVVFCADERSADQVFSYLKGRRVNAVRHGVDDASEELDSEPWREFISVPDVRVLVCDRRAEEGVNLQGGNKAIVHFDLPLQPNRIEQRMGRVDRYGAGSPVPSFVLLDKEAPLQLSWFRILDEGLGVFSRSISSLQYLVESEISTLSQSLIYEGAEAFDSSRDRLSGDSGGTARELRLIDQQDALDQLSPLPEQELDDLFDADADWREIGKAMLYWIEETLLFAKVNLSLPGGKPLVDTPFRFHYRSPEAGTGWSTLIPLSEFIDNFLGAIDFDAPGSRSNRPQSYPYVTHRPTAVRLQMRPFRYGSEFVESIRSFSELDVRGRSYAMWRQVFTGFQPGEIRMYFRFDFLIETCLDEAQEVLEEERNCLGQLGHSSLARRGDTLFRPTVFQVWLDEDGDELPEDFIERYLAPEYSKHGNGDYIDKNLDSSYLDACKRWMPDTLNNWQERCERMRDKAKVIVQTKPGLIAQQQDALERAASENEIRYAQIRTRIQAMKDKERDVERAQLALEEKLNMSLRNGISAPSIRVDVAGVIFLTTEPVPVLDEYMRKWQ